MAKFFSKLKKGFSIAEVVIAIAIISIISVGAITTITLSIKNQRKNLTYQDINFTCSTVIDCFRFNSELSTLSDIYCDNYNSTEKTINRNTYTIIITVDGNTIYLSAVDKNDNELYKVHYVK